MRTAAFLNAINNLHEYYSMTGLNNWFYFRDVVFIDKIILYIY